MASKWIWYKLLITLFSFNTIVDAQLVTVTDLERGTPVEAAILLQPGTNKYSVTDSTGKTDITHLSEPGVIEVQHIGYKTM